MSIRTINILLIGILIVGGCSDTITNHYRTRDEAEADNLFGRGWLPSLIPMSSRDITTSNNLDINISEGEFWYDQKESADFLIYLNRYSGQKTKLDRWQTYISEQMKEGYKALVYSADKTIWVFMVNTSMGHVRYVMWLQYS